MGGQQHRRVDGGRVFVRGRALTADASEDWTAVWSEVVGGEPDAGLFSRYRDATSGWQDAELLDYFPADDAALRPDDTGMGVWAEVQPNGDYIIWALDFIGYGGFWSQVGPTLPGAAAQRVQDARVAVGANYRAVVVWRPQRLSRDAVRIAGRV